MEYTDTIHDAIEALAGINLQQISLGNKLSSEEVNFIVTHGIVHLAKDILYDHDFIPPFDFLERV